MRLRATRMSLGSWPLIPLPLDNLNAAVAYSLRKLRNAYTGPAIRGRRSNDNAEQDIGFKIYIPEREPRLNEEELMSFAGANSVFVTTWYDQSGNARNAVQTSAALQPRIVESGVISKYAERPMIDFAVSIFAAMNISGTVDVQHFSVVIDNRSSTTFPVWESILFNNSPRRPMLFGFNQTAGLGIDYPATIYVNGTETATFLTPPPANTPRAVWLALNSVITGNSTLRLGYSDLGYNGRFGEAIIFSTALSTFERQNLERNQGAYYNITVA